jgi:outer membrane protein
MMRLALHRPGRPLRALLAIAACAAPARPAFALQPVTEFLEHARTWNPQNRAAHATAVQRDEEVAVSTGSLLPSLSAQGTYTRNQYEVAPPGFGVIQPQNQLDANVTLTVPLINIANWDRRAAAKASLSGARADEKNTRLVVVKSVLRDYYTLLGDEAVLSSAAKNVEVAQHNLALAHDRKESGTGSELDVQRAAADRARADQALTAAQLAVTNTRRDLYSLSGLQAEPGAEFPQDDLHEEAPLESWLGKTGAVPAVQSAVANRERAEEGARAANTAWLPSIEAKAEEKFTNATAFLGGRSAAYLLQLVASWQLDTTIRPQIRAQNAAAAAARASEDQARQAAEDAVFLDWQQIRSDIESARSSRAQVAATTLAASLAEDRYQSGVATQLDVLQARQDAFSADVARIQADADLAYARLALRVDAAQFGVDAKASPVVDAKASPVVDAKASPVVDAKASPVVDAKASPVKEKP